MSHPKLATPRTKSPSCQGVPRSVLAVAVVIGALMPFGTSTANAGTYPVSQCNYELGIATSAFTWQVVESPSTPSVIPHANSGCSEFGLGVRTSNWGDVQTYADGSLGGYVAHAPAGTVFTKFSGSFGTLNTCCVSGMDAWAEVAETLDGGGDSEELFRGSLGPTSWQSPSASFGPVRLGWDADAAGFKAKRLSYRLGCGLAGGCLQSATGDLRLRARSFELEVEDQVSPEPPDVAGDLLENDWNGGTGHVALLGEDTGSGVRSLEIRLDSEISLESIPSCSRVGGRYVSLQPCPLNASHSWSFDSGELSDGEHVLVARVTDAGGASSELSRTVKVDNTAPGPPAPALVDGPGGWRRTNGFVIHPQAPASQHAPLKKVHYKICLIQDGANCDASPGTSENLERIEVSVPGPGAYELRLWFEDEARNVDPGLRSDASLLRFDDEAPVGAFRASDLLDPRLLRVDVADATSGVASGHIEYRRQGDKGFTRLVTARDGGLLSARLDDLAMAPGQYEIRAVVKDVAGNQAVISQRLSGAAMMLGLPLRASTGVDVSTSVDVRTCKKSKRRRSKQVRQQRKCRTKSVERPAYSPLKLAHGKTLVSTGRLKTQHGTPIAGANVAVEGRLRSGGGFAPLGVARTDQRGMFRFTVPAGPSRTVRYRYDGSNTTRPSTAEVVTRVRAAARLKVNRRRLRNGQAVRFSGRLLGKPIPSGGKLVALQARVGRRWRTFATPRTNAKGVFRYRYRFTATTGVRRYAFRALVTPEAAYPYERAPSPAVGVTVRGR